MPQEPFGKRLTAPAVILALVAVAASRGVPALLVALILLPPFSAVLAVTAGWWGGAMVCAGAAAACLLVLPADAWILSLAWCVLCAVIPLVKVRKPLHRPMLWAALCLVTWAGGIAIDRKSVV